MILDKRLDELIIPLNGPFFFYFIVGINSEVKMSCSVYCSPTISECRSWL